MMEVFFVQGSKESGGGPRCLFIAILLYKLGEDNPVLWNVDLWVPVVVASLSFLNSDIALSLFTFSAFSEVSGSSGID